VDCAARGRIAGNYHHDSFYARPAPDHRARSFNQRQNQSVDAARRDDSTRLFSGRGNNRQAAAQFASRKEFFLTAAQSLFGLALLLCLRLSLKSAFALLGLFLVQFGLSFYFHNDESRTIVVLTYMAWLYLVLAAGIFIRNYRCLIECFRTGLLARETSPE